LAAGNKTTEVVIMLTTSNLRKKTAATEVIVKYIKNDLYPKVKFFQKVKEDLTIGGLISNDFKESCRRQIGDHKMTEGIWATYMEAVWNACLTYHV
jgi:hypothetical protein